MGRSIVRLKDIADKTGFSANTVSLALRNSPRIPEPTRQLIREAAAELNYLPNQIAKSLVSRQTRTIGLVLTDITNPVLARVAKTVEIALAERGYGTLFATSNNTHEQELRAIEMFRARQVDGMLIYPSSHRELEHLRPLRRANHPIVLLVGDTDAGIDAVCMDERLGAYKAVRHLVQTGHRRIGLIDAGSRHGNEEKREGYERALQEAGIGNHRELAADPQGYAVADGYAAAGALMQRGARPTAIFAANDRLALGALNWCLAHDRRVPDDIAIAGMDNIEYAEFAPVPLTTVAYAVEAVTEMAVERLMRLIAAGEELPPAEVTQIEPELVVRASTLRRA